MLDFVIGYLGPTCRFKEWAKAVHEFGHVLKMHAPAHVVEVEPLEAELFAFAVNTAVLVECFGVLLEQLSNLSLSAMLVD